MTPASGEPGAGPARGLASSIARLARTLVATLHSRAELFTLEIARERARVVRLILLSVAALVFGALALFTATIFVIILFWDGHRLMASGLLALLYVCIAAVLASLARQQAARAARPFASTLEELRKDRDGLM